MWGPSWLCATQNQKPGERLIYPPCHIIPYQVISYQNLLQLPLKEPLKELGMPLQTVLDVRVQPVTLNNGCTKHRLKLLYMRAEQRAKSRRRNELKGRYCIRVYTGVHMYIYRYVCIDIYIYVCVCLCCELFIYSLNYMHTPIYIYTHYVCRI